jgi:hypothetical protein
MRRALLPALLLLLAGCRFGLPPAGPAEGRDWTEARLRWSRSARLYDRFAAHAFVGAAYQSAALRRARVEQVATWRAMTESERKGLAEAEAADGALWEEFLVSMFTVDGQDNDLDLRQSIWRMALVVEGEGEALPAEVRGVRPDAQLRELYPFIGDFDLVYRVRYPRWKGAPLDGRKFLLRIAGAEGQMDLDFSEAATPARR